MCLLINKLFINKSSANCSSNTQITSKDFYTSCNTLCIKYKICGSTVFRSLEIWFYSQDRNFNHRENLC